MPLKPRHGQAKRGRRTRDRRPRRLLVPSLSVERSVTASTGINLRRDVVPALLAALWCVAEVARALTAYWQRLGARPGG